MVGRKSAILNQVFDSFRPSSHANWLRYSRQRNIQQVKRIPEKLTRNARHLRNNATPAERILWNILCQYRPRFTRQLPIVPYIVDFAHRKAKLVIELDGSQHLDSKEEDFIRTEYLVKRGWKELRFWNSEVMENTHGVAEIILKTAAERLGGKELEAVPPRKRKREPD